MGRILVRFIVHLQVNCASISPPVSQVACYTNSYVIQIVTVTQLIAQPGDDWLYGRHPRKQLPLLVQLSLLYVINRMVANMFAAENTKGSRTPCSDLGQECWRSLK